MNKKYLPTCRESPAHYITELLNAPPPTRSTTSVTYYSAGICLIILHHLMIISITELVFVIYIYDVL